MNKMKKSQKIGSRNLPKNDHIKSRADAERTISCFVAYRTSTLPFFSEGPSIILHETSLSLAAPACETNS